MIKELSVFLAGGALAGALAAVEVGANWWGTTLVAAVGALLGGLVWLEFSKDDEQE